jgi:hypothetical protein
MANEYLLQSSIRIISPYLKNAVHKLPCSLNFGRSGRDLKANCLKLTNRPSKLLPLIGIVDGDICSPNFPPSCKALNPEKSRDRVF